MSVLVNQMVNVRVRGVIDQQTADVPSLWFYNNSGDAIPTKNYCEAIAKVWNDYLMPFLTQKYEVYRIEAWVLGGLQVTTRGPSGSETYRSTREIWKERYVLPVDYAGGGGNIPAASFNAFGVQKAIGQSWLISASTGSITNVTPNVPVMKSGGMRLPGVDESSTGTGEPNLIRDAVRMNIQNGVKYLDGHLVPVSDGTSVQLEQLVLSKSTLTGPRLDKSASPTDPTQWLPNWAAAYVTSLTVADVLTSQTSRKRKPGKYN